jgi:ketosteroid isomerase-like protein
MSKSARATNSPRHQANPEGDKQQRAMARRLEQLNAALGESEGGPGKAAVIRNPPTAANAGKSVGTGSLILTSMLSALFGAGLMWWQATPHEQGLSAPSQALHAAATPISVPTTSEPLRITPATPEITDEKRISDLLEAWRSAWTQRDIAAYLNAYSQQFAPADGNSRDGWVAARTKKLSTGAPIDIQMHDLAIERIDADQFKATFLQDYASGSYRETARAKTLLMAREGGEWRIRQERLEETRLAIK